MGVIILVYGFTSRLVKLFPQLAKPITVYLRHPASRAVQAALRALVGVATRMRNHRGYLSRCVSNFWEDLIVLPSFGLYIAYRSAIHMFNSVLAEVS